MAEKLSQARKVGQVGSIHPVAGKAGRLAVSKKPTADVGRAINLPSEVLLRIFCFLDAQSVLACASTCRRWALIANDNSLWKGLYCHYFGQKQPPPSLCANEKHWKQRFMKLAKKKRDRVFLKSVAVRRPCDFAYRAKDLLGRLGNKFEISLTTSMGKVCVYSEKARAYGLFAIVLQWYDLGEFPAFEEVKKIEIFSRTPIMIGNSGKMLTKGPKQKCLVLSDERLDRSCISPVPISDEISYVGLQSGILIGMWRKTKNIAFISASLHTYQLLNKCLLSTLENIATCQHVIKHDDVSRLYGLQNYEFHIQVATGDLSNLFNCHISSDVMDMRQEASTVSYRVKNPLRIFAFKEPSLAWNTDLFKGEIPQLTFFTLTVIDLNEDVIFNVSQPAKCEIMNKISTDFESSEKSGITLVCFDTEAGSGRLILGRHYSCDRFGDSFTDEGFYLDALEMIFNIEYINQWFGTHY